MVLKILPQREPFARRPVSKTLASLATTSVSALSSKPEARTLGPANIIRGAAYERLHSALEKYLRKNSLGRSYVVSGNRGIGKSTMVLAVIEDLTHQSNRENGERESRDEAPAPVETPSEQPLCRPLLVFLSGADIIREEKRPAKPDQAGTAAAASPPREVADSDNLLRQIARALHVSLIREFSKRYALTVAHEGVDADLREAWAQLSAELHEGARVQTLRRFWDLPGRLQRGVLFEKEVSKRQGLCELLALDASAAAYRIAIGKVSEDNQLTINENAGAEKPTSREDIQGMFAPLLGLTGGAVTGVGVHQLVGTSSLFNLLASIGAALLSALVLTLSIAPKRTSVAEAKSKFSPDTELGSLTWRLNCVVERLFDAGLAPVFLLDELDKVTPKPEFNEWLAIRAQDLKSFLTERAFFCFLTGRDFAEKLYTERTFRTYPPSYTQFSDYLFVNYLPQELHAFLRKLIVTEDVGSSGAVPSTPEAIQCAILRFVLLFRAEMHPIDIRRELNALIRHGDTLELAQDGVPQADRFALMFQMVVESVLARPEVERRIRADARFALLAVDAVYYAPRQWRRGETLDTSPAAIDAYLEKRRGPDEAEPTLPSPEPAANADAPGTGPAPPSPVQPKLAKLPASDKSLLRDCAMQVIDLLQRREDTAGKASGPSEQIRDRVAALANELWFLDRLSGAQEATSDERARKAMREAAKPIAAELVGCLPDVTQLLDNEPGGVCRWRYDQYGLELLSPDSVESATAPAEAFFELEKIDASLRKELSFSLDALATSFELVKDPLTWAMADHYADRLRKTSTIGQQTSETRTIATGLQSYVKGIRDALLPLAQATMLCTAIEPATAIKDALLILVQALELDKLPLLKDRYARIGECWALLKDKLPQPAIDSTSLPRDDGYAAALQASLQGVSLPPLAAQNWINEFWVKWRQRALDRWDGVPAEIPPGLPELTMRLKRTGRLTSLELAWRQHTLSDWTDVIMSALDGKAASDGIVYQKWCGPLALIEVGASRLAFALPEEAMPELGPRRNRLQAKDQQRLVVVQGSSSSLSWTTTSNFGALVVRRADTKRLADAIETATKQARDSIRGELGWLVVESDPSEEPRAPEDLLQDTTPFWRDLWPAPRRAQLFAQTPKAIGLLSQAQQKITASKPLVIVGARSLEDAVALCDAELRKRTESPQA